MTRAYDELYLKDAMRNVGAMVHFCINEYGLNPDDFYEAFLRSRVSAQIAKGNPRYLVGYSGKELADIVVDGLMLPASASEEYVITPEYWAGWLLAYYQWYTAQDFRQIHASGLDFSKLIKMYNPLHEADLLKCVETLETYSAHSL